MEISAKKTLFLSMVLIGTFILFGFHLEAFCDELTGEGPRHEQGEGFIQQLDLTPQQQKALRKQREEEKKEMGSLRRELREQRKELFAELKQPETDMKKVDSTVGRIKDLQGKLIDNRVQHFFEMKKVLTPEQLESLIDSYDGPHKKKQKKRFM